MRFIKKHKIFIALLCLFLIALALRVYKLGTTPEALTWDEAALGYNSYSLLKTGADEYGHKMPLVLRSFDDYKPALYAYFTAPMIALFGLNIFSIRLVSALAGASMVFSVYFLGKNLTKNNAVGVIAAVLAVASPIFLLYSRIALEANLSLAIFTAGLAFLSSKENTKRFAIGALLLVLSAYSYHSARYLVPLIVFTASFHPLNRSLITKKIQMSILAGLLYIPILYFVLNAEFNTRFSETSIFTKSGLLTGNMIVSWGHQYFYLLDIFGRYLSYFNPHLLFVKATGHPLYHLDGIGALNIWEAPFWLLGMFKIVNKKLIKNPIIWVVLLFAAMPAAVTVDWFSPLRALLLFPIFLVITALGVKHAFGKAARSIKYLLSFGSICILWSFYALRVVETTFYYQPYVHAGEYQYGFAESVPYVASLIENHKYDNVIVDTPHAQPHIFYLVFSGYPPEDYQKEIAWRVNDNSPRYNFDFGPYTFRKIYWPDDRSLKNTLFVGNVFSLPYEQLKNSPNARILKEFYQPDGNISTVIVATN